MSQRARCAILALATVLLAVFVLASRGRPHRGEAAEAPVPPAREAKPVPEWERPRFEDRAGERQRMVRRYIQGEGIRVQAVLEAMSHVPRHEFVPERRRNHAYANIPLPIGHGQTISQPYIVGYMTAALQLQAGEKVLEIGTGSGYQAAILSEITPHVFSIEIIRALADEAKERLARLGYKTIQCRLADGYYGWPEDVAFDAIIVTCAAGSIPPPLVKQLKPGGRMIIPVGPPGLTQRLVLVTKDESGKVRSKSLIPVAFVPLTRRVR